MIGTDSLEGDYTNKLISKQKVRDAIEKYQQKVLFDTNKVDVMDREYELLLKELFGDEE